MGQFKINNFNMEEAETWKQQTLKWTIAILPEKNRMLWWRSPAFFSVMYPAKHTPLVGGIDSKRDPKQTLLLLYPIADVDEKNYNSFRRRNS